MPLLALGLAWLVPGAGHVYLGRVRRGIILFVVIGAMFWAGIAMGGVMTVDYHKQRWWFVAEMFSGIHGLVGWQRQKRVYQDLAARPDIGPPPTKATEKATWQIKVDQALSQSNLAVVYPTDTIAQAYAGVAGLLNLMCVFDAVMLSLLGTVGEPAAITKSPQDAPNP